MSKQNISETIPDTTNTFKAKTEAPPPPEVAINYHFEYKRIWTQKDSFEGYNHQYTIAALNRTDIIHLKRLDSFLVPDIYKDTLLPYFPFAANVPAIADIEKIIFFSYPTQSFAAYENGKLIITGPTSMGKKATKTPTGLFFCNWKAKEIRSTVDNEWILKWNYNVSNFGGVGFHEYALPGYPASHSCMRLLSEQAQFLYDWAKQWKLKDGKLLAKGTPVIIYGEYPFGQPRPWFALVKDADALDISETMLKEIVAPYKDEILKEQSSRNQLFPPVTDTTSENLAKK
ncbi:MAG: L,D-transpeptidase [Chitinophagaceae bacterium]|nr:L,D-transpeptidase [Chitinophagaceae bacterium]